MGRDRARSTAKLTKNKPSLFNSNSVSSIDSRAKLLMDQIDAYRLASSQMQTREIALEPVDNSMMILENNNPTRSSITASESAALEKAKTKLYPDSKAFR